MSYDISNGYEDFKHTYNCAKMFYSAHPKGIRAHYGMTGRDAVPVLRAMREHMENNWQAMKDMEPENGWGSAESAIEVLHQMIRAAIRKPDAVWDGD
jgi:hypothetical protein